MLGRTALMIPALTVGPGSSVIERSSARRASASSRAGRACRRASSARPCRSPCSPGARSASQVCGVGVAARGLQPAFLERAGIALGLVPAQRAGVAFGTTSGLPSIAEVLRSAPGEARRRAAARPAAARSRAARGAGRTFAMHAPLIAACAAGIAGQVHRRDRSSCRAASATTSADASAGTAASRSSRGHRLVAGRATAPAGRSAGHIDRPASSLE